MALRNNFGHHIIHKMATNVLALQEEQKRKDKEAKMATNALALQEQNRKDEEAKQRQKNIITGIIVSIVILAIAGGLYFMYRRTKHKKNELVDTVVNKSAEKSPNCDERHTIIVRGRTSGKDMKSEIASQMEKCPQYRQDKYYTTLRENWQFK